MHTFIFLLAILAAAALLTCLAYRFIFHRLVPTAAKAEAEVAYDTHVVAGAIDNAVTIVATDTKAVVTDAEQDAAKL